MSFLKITLSEQKVEGYELMGRSTANTELDNVKDMTWQRADPNNVAYKVNQRIGEERLQVRFKWPFFNRKQHSKLTISIENSTKKWPFQ